MAKKQETKTYNRLLRLHNLTLENLRNRLSNCKSDDIKVLLKRDITELEQKIQRVKELDKQ